MSFVPYNLNIPLATNSPSSDQPLMEANTNAVNTILDVDHYSFNDSLGGTHQQVQLPIRGGGSGTIPPGLFSGEGTLYTKTSAAETNLFYTPDASGKEYQLTATNTTNFSLFASDTNYIAPATTLGGWTFIAGGLIFQYGTIISIGTTTTINFPRTFTTLFSVTFSTKTTTASRLSNENNASFDIVTSSSTTGIRFYWFAIGN